MDIPSMYITTLDYNNYFVNGSNGFLAKIGGSSYSTLLTLQNGTLHEANGNVSDPLFASPLSSSPYGYIIQSTLPGTPLTQVPTDYFGNSRPATPSMGAIEYGSAQPYFSDSTVSVCDYFKYRGDSIVASGTYTYTHFTGLICDTVFSLYATITASPVAPTISGPNSQTGTINMCVNGFVTLYGNNGGTWNNNSTSNSIQVTQPGNYYVVKTNGNCVDTSNVITVAQFPTLNSASVMITTSLTNTNIICQGASVTFTAYPINGGTAPVYIWSKNNNLLVSGTNYSTYTTNSISNGDVFRCAINSNYPCLSNNASVFSNPITIFTNSVPALTISTPNGTDFCTGQSVMLSSPAGTS